MSVTRCVETEFHDPTVMMEVAKELGAVFRVGAPVEASVSGEPKPSNPGKASITPFKVNLWGTPIEAVMSVHLPGWKYPVAITADGKAYYDNHGGAWGAQNKLDQLKQTYAVGFVKAQAARQGFKVKTSQTQADGTVRLVLA